MATKMLSDTNAAYMGGDAGAEAVNSAEARALYKARVAIYPKLVHGRFRGLKWAFMVLLLSVYYLVPWIRWDRGPGAPNQAVLVDFEHARFYFFFIEIWPQEVYYITGLLILSAIGLFLVTALFGRVWCGYACPQTVWTDLYIAVERLVEGDRNERLRLARAPWSANKFRKKVVKHAIWLAIAAATGGAWVFYFHDAPSLAATLFKGTAPGSSYLFMALLTFTTYMLAGSMREQVCTYMCPWPRIQGALTDADALNVTYRYDRGEPRGAHKKGEPWEGRGDCIDCKQCIVACPMGIDIRDGSQLECIHCALCIDACNDIMTRIDRPKGLISYDSENNIARRLAGEKRVTRFIRPRTVFYGIVALIVASAMLVGLLTRATFEISVLKDRNPTFVMLSDGAIRNGYQVRIVNREHTRRTLILDLEPATGLSSKIIGLDGLGPSYEIELAPSSVRTVKVYTTLSADHVSASKIRTLSFNVSDPQTGEAYRNSAAFTRAK